MACGFGETAEDCAVLHWSPPLKGEREPSGQWRADCPVPGCHTGRRALEYDVPGRSKSIRWKSFCGTHDKEAMRPYVAKLIGQCMPGGGGRQTIKHDELIALTLAGLPPQSLRLGLLELAGMPTGEALAELGVGPTHKRRVIDPLRKLGSYPFR